MIAATLEFLNFQQSNPVQEFQNQIQQIRSKADAIHSLGEKIITLDNGVTTTELLLNLENRNQQTYHLPFSLVALQIQSHSLLPTCFFPFFLNVKRLFDTLNPDFAVLYVAEVEDIFRAVAESAIAANQPKVVVKTLRKIISLSWPNGHAFSPMYAFYLQTCIKGQLYGVGLEFIQQREVYHITDRAHNFGEEYLKYFYYSGICYLSAKNYQAALEGFLTCITTPSNAVSQVIVNAIKKSKIVSLLTNGEKFYLPKYTSSPVLRFFHDDLQPYDSIVERFLGDDLNELGNVILNNETALQADNNFGIAKLLLSAWKFNKIQKISKSFITLSIPELTEAINLKDDALGLEKSVFDMISQGKIVASIHSTEGIISFEEPSLNQREFQKKKAQVVDEVEGSLENILRLSSLLRDSQKEILTSTEYIQKVTSTGRSSGFGGGGNVWGVASTMEFS